MCLHTWAAGIGTSKAARRIGFITSSSEPVALPHHHHRDSAGGHAPLRFRSCHDLRRDITRVAAGPWPGGRWVVISKVPSGMETFLSPGRGTPIWLLGISSLGSWRVTARLNDLYARELKYGTWLGQPDARLRTREEMMRACPRAPPKGRRSKRRGGGVGRQPGVRSLLLWNGAGKFSQPQYRPQRPAAILESWTAGRGCSPFRYRVDESCIGTNAQCNSSRRLSMQR